MRRLLESPRAVDTIAIFHEEWLALHDFDRISFDVVDESIGPELRDAIAREPSSSDICSTGSIPSWKATEPSSIIRS